jgi:membrane protein YqaA with SNARE-associated domain
MTLKPGSPHQSWLKRSIDRLMVWLMIHGQRPYAIGFLAALAILDCVLPLMPAELLALSLMILQPRRIFLIAIAFAWAAAASAGVLATLVTGIAQQTALEAWLDSERQSVAWGQALSLIKDWGGPALAFAAIFPDSPRTPVAAAALGGLSPLSISSYVLAGKLFLYVLLALAVRFIPGWRPAASKARWPVTRQLHRAIQRFAALRRWVEQQATKKT